MWKKITTEQKQILKNTKKGDMVSLDGIGIIKVVKDKRKKLCERCIFDKDTSAWSCGFMCGITTNRKYLVKFIREEKWQQ